MNLSPVVLVDIESRFLKKVDLCAWLKQIQGYAIKAGQSASQ